MGLWADPGDDPRYKDSGEAPDTQATWLRRSVALLFGCGLARTPRLTKEVVMEGSVAQARGSLGLLLLLDVEESRRCTARRESRGMEAMCCGLGRGVYGSAWCLGVQQRRMEDV